MNLISDLEYLIIRLLDKSSKFSLSWTCKKYRNMNILDIIEKDYCSVCSRDGNLNLLKWSYNQGCPITDDSQRNAASNGHIHILKWFNKRIDLIEGLDCDAAKGTKMGGHLKILKWLGDMDYEFNRDNYEYALDGCIQYKFNMSRQERKKARQREIKQLEIIEWLGDGKSDSGDTDHYLIENAARKGCLRIIKYVCHGSGYSIGDSAYIAAEYGHLNILRWLYKNDYEIDDDCYVSALNCGGFDDKDAVEENILKILKWLSKHDIEFSIRSFEIAARRGYIRILEWLFENESDLIMEKYNIVSESAAGDGQLEVLLWLISKGYELNYIVSESAICKGQIDIVKWCIKNNIPICENTYKVAIINNQLEMLKYLIKNKITSKDDNDHKEILLEYAVLYSSDKICQYLLDCGHTYNKRKLMKISNYHNKRWVNNLP